MNRLVYTQIVTIFLLHTSASWGMFPSGTGTNDLNKMNIHFITKPWNAPIEVVHPESSNCFGDITQRVKRDIEQNGDKEHAGIRALNNQMKDLNVWVYNNIVEEQTEDYLDQVIQKTNELANKQNNAFLSYVQAQIATRQAFEKAHKNNDFRSLNQIQNFVILGKESEKNKVRWSTENTEKYKGYLSILRMYQPYVQNRATLDSLTQAARKKQNIIPKISTTGRGIQKRK